MYKDSSKTLAFQKLNDAIAKISTTQDHETLSNHLFDLVRDFDNFEASETERLHLAIEILTLQTNKFFIQKELLLAHFQGNKNIIAKFSQCFQVKLFDLASKSNTVPLSQILVLLLIIRTTITEPYKLQKMTAWHNSVIPNLSFLAASLIYNTMFTHKAKMYEDNVAELMKVIPEMDWVKQWNEFGLKKCKLFLYFWPDGAPVGQLQALKKWLLQTPQKDQEPKAYKDFYRLLTQTIDKQPNLIQIDPSKKINQRANRIKSKIIQAIPFAALPKKSSLKVAILVSGQLRGFDKTVHNWKKSILKGLDVDFYVHTWNEIGLSGTEPFRKDLPFNGSEFNKAYRVNGNRLGYQELKTRYPKFYKTINSYGVVDHAQLSEIYETDQIIIEDANDDQFLDWSNPRKMYYKMSQVQTLLDASDKEYDLVVRLRPDKAIHALQASWSQIHRLLKTPNVVLAELGYGLHFGDLMLGDQFAIGTQENMSRFNCAYEMALTEANDGLIDLNKDLKGHTSLASHCLFNHLKVGKFPAHFGGLLTAKNLPSSVIKELIIQDAMQRMDSVDHALINAVNKDLAHLG